ncbi:MAG: OmpA family protein [Ekhidna sp.]|uniref:OmpA family protein n=1 Tax=Ekhidna sp. TaxID=2608089 RepID=UPI0032ED42DF
MRKAIFLFTILMTSLAIAQENSTMVSRIIRLGDDYFKNDQYIEAIRYYKEALAESPSNLKAQYQLAECYRLIRDYESAEYHYETISAEPDIRFPLAGYYHAMMQKLKGRYDQALQNFKEFRNYLSENELHETDDYRYYYKQAKIEIDGCALALNQITLVHPDHQFSALERPLNSEYNDYAAFSVGTDDIVCLTSARGNGKNDEYDTQFGEAFADLFRFTRVGGEWKEVDQSDRFEKMINTKYGDGSGSFNRERTKFYYTNCDEDIGAFCHIYVSSLEGGRWSEPRALNTNINEFGFSSKHPNLTPGGDTLFYVSDREGGLGQLDIYMSISAGDENWGPPIHLGDQINTPFNEVSPFYDQSERVLFFASNGHRGFGGFDIYIARGAKFESAEIYNAGIPFNSYRDDIFFFMGKNRGFLSSNREEGGVGKFDIYGFNVQSKRSIISEVSSEETIAGRNSLFTDDYNFDSNETEIINQIISRMLSSSVSEVDLILTERQLAVYNSLSADDKERIEKIVNARVRKMTSNMIRSIRTEDDYYYQQLSSDKRQKVDNIVSTYLEQQGMGNSVNLTNEVFSFYSGVSSDEREKIDVLISDRLKNAQNFKPATPTYNSFKPDEQKKLDGIAIKYLKQKRNLQGMALDVNEKAFLNNNKENTEDVNAAIRERLIGLSNEEKYRLLKEDRDFYESLDQEDKDRLKSIATTFMVSDLTTFDQNVSNDDLSVFNNKNAQEQSRLDKLLLKQISNLANSSIYLTETTFSQDELQSAISGTSEETVDKLLKLRPELTDLQKSAVERFVRTAYDSYLTEVKPVFFDTTPTVASVSGQSVDGADPSARLSASDVNQYESLSDAKKRVIDNVIALDYITTEYTDRLVRLSDEQKLTEVSNREKLYIAALAKKVSGQEIKPNEQSYIKDAFTFYNNLAQDRKAFINRAVLDKGLPKRNSKYVLPESDARNRNTLTASEQSLLEKIKKFRFNNDRILTENLAMDAKDVDEAPVDLMALVANVGVDDQGSKKLIGAEDILASEELDEIKITLPIDKIEGYDEITISGKLVGANSGRPLSSYAITLIEFDNTKTVIEGYTNINGQFEFKVSPTKYDLTFKKANDAESVVLEDFNVEGRREKEAGIFTNATRAFFDVNSSQLRPEVTILLDEVIAAFRRSGDKIEIESHTDDTGAAEYNLVLSKDRGYSARDYLISKGIDQSKISVIWHGSEKPIADNSNPYGRQLNRRIDVRMIGKRKVSFGNFYLIRPGATVDKLSGSMGVSAEEIRNLNGLGSSDLSVYQPIRLKKDEEIEPDYNLVVPADIKSGSDFIYTVKPGDNLQIVSKKFNVPEELIMEQNGLTSTDLEPGTRLIIYPKN